MQFRRNLILKVFSVLVILSIFYTFSHLPLLPFPCLLPDFTPLLISPLPHAFFLLALSLPATPNPKPPSTSLFCPSQLLDFSASPFQPSQRWLIQCIYRKTDWIIRINQEWWCSLLQTVDFIISPEWEWWAVVTVVHHMQKLTLWRKGCCAW